MWSLKLSEVTPCHPLTEGKSAECCRLCSREVEFPELQRAACVGACCHLLPIPFSYFLFLYHVLLKSTFHFNASGSVMDLFSPSLPPEHTRRKRV